ncbi:MAG: FtsW/RodA/SpoVE family cell cycle protein [Ruminococcus sp.]
MNYRMDFFKKTDVLLWLSTLTALGCGLLLIASMQRSGSYNYLLPQLLASAIGLCLAVLFCLADYRYPVAKWYFPAGIGLLLTASVFVFGMRVSGTDDTAWLVLPGGLTVQPSEFIKICFILTFSQHLAWLAEKDRLKSPLWLLTLLLHALLPVAAIHFQGDDGTALIFLMMAPVMALAAGVQCRWLIISGSCALVSLPVLWIFVLNDAQRSRLTALLCTDGSTMTDYGWQQFQGKLSLASGGFAGSGLFRGARVGSGIVPEQENDFILTVAGEELGFLGCLLILFLLWFIAVRLLKGIGATDDLRGKCVCGGVFSMIAAQSVINLGMELGMLPVIGVTLPLFSAGGSSLLSTLIAVGLAQSVNYHRETELNTGKLRIPHRIRR